MTTVTLIETRSVKLPRNSGSHHKSVFSKVHIAKGLHLSRPYSQKTLQTENITLCADGISLSHRYEIIPRTKSHPEPPPNAPKTSPRRHGDGEGIDINDSVYTENINDADDTPLEVIGLKPQSLSALPLVSEKRDHYSRNDKNTKEANSELSANVVKELKLTSSSTSLSPYRPVSLLTPATPIAPYASPCPTESDFSIDGHRIWHVGFNESLSHGVFEKIHDLSSSNATGSRHCDRRECRKLPSKYRPFSSASKYGDVASRQFVNGQTRKNDTHSSDTSLRYSISGPGLSWNRDISLGLSETDQVSQESPNSITHHNADIFQKTHHSRCQERQDLNETPSPHSLNHTLMKESEKNFTVFDYNFNGRNDGTFKILDSSSNSEESRKMHEMIAEAKDRGVLLDPWPFIEDQPHEQGHLERYSCLDDFGYDWKHQKSGLHCATTLSYTYRSQGSNLPSLDASSPNDEKSSEEEDTGVYDMYNKICKEKLEEVHSQHTNKHQRGHSSLLPELLIPKGTSLCYTPMVDKRYNKWRRRKRRKGRTFCTERKLLESSSDESSSDEKEYNDCENDTNNTVNDSIILASSGNANHLPQLEKDTPLISAQNNQHGQHSCSRQNGMPNPSLNHQTKDDWDLGDSKMKKINRCQIYQHGVRVATEAGRNTNLSRKPLKPKTCSPYSENCLKKTDNSEQRTCTPIKMEPSCSPPMMEQKSEPSGRYWPHILNSTQMAEEDSASLVYWQQQLSPRGAQTQVMQQHRHHNLASVDNHIARTSWGLKHSISSNWRDLASDRSIHANNMFEEKEGPLRLELGFSSESIKSATKTCKSQPTANTVRARTVLMLSRKKNNAALTNDMQDGTVSIAPKTQPTDILKNHNTSNLNELLRANTIVNHDVLSPDKKSKSPMSTVKTGTTEDPSECSHREKKISNKILKPVTPRNKEMTLFEKDRMKSWHDANIAPMIPAMSSKEPLTSAQAGSNPKNISRQQSFNVKDEYLSKGLHSLIHTHRMDRNISSLSFTPAFTYSMFQLPDIYKWYNTKIQKKN